MSERGVQMERDVWILLRSVSPKEAAIWFADKLDAMEDPLFRGIYVDYDIAYDWPADEPRLAELADRTARWLAGRHTEVEEAAAIQDPALAQLVSSSVAVLSPAWDRLARLTKERMRPDEGSL